MVQIILILEINIPRRIVGPNNRTDGSYRIKTDIVLDNKVKLRIL